MGPVISDDKKPAALSSEVLKPPHIRVLEELCTKEGTLTQSDRDKLLIGIARAVIRLST